MMLSNADASCLCRRFQAHKTAITRERNGISTLPVALAPYTNLVRTCSELSQPITAFVMQAKDRMFGQLPTALTTAAHRQAGNFVCSGCVSKVQEVEILSL